MMPLTLHVEGEQLNISFRQFVATPLRGVRFQTPLAKTCLDDESSQPDLTKKKRLIVLTSPLDGRIILAAPVLNKSDYPDISIFGARSLTTSPVNQVSQVPLSLPVPSVSETGINVDDQDKLTTKNLDTKEVEISFKRNADGQISTRPEKLQRLSTKLQEKDCQGKSTIDEYSDGFNETNKSVSSKLVEMADGLDLQNNQNARIVLAAPVLNESDYPDISIFDARSLTTSPVNQVSQVPLSLPVPSVSETGINVDDQDKLTTKNLDTKEVEISFKRNADSHISTRPEKLERLSTKLIEKDCQGKATIDEYSDEVSEFKQFIRSHIGKMTISDIISNLNSPIIDKTDKSVSIKLFEMADGLDLQNNQNASMVLKIKQNGVSLKVSDTTIIKNLILAFHETRKKNIANEEQMSSK